jgi:hypothetical protein
MRTGSEPTQARSALRLRLGFTVWGLLWAIAGTAIFASVGRPGWAIACGVVALIAAADLGVIVHRIHQGAHWQPGRNVPPYWSARH